MIKGFNHIGISVVDLDRSVEFYTKAFGMKVVCRWNFAADTHQGKYDRILNLKGATGRGAAVEVGNLQMEMFEFSAPTPKRNAPNASVADHGISHFCVEVSDIEAEYERLRAMGVTFHCPPLPFGPKARATYGRDPDGNVFELIDLGTA